MIADDLLLEIIKIFQFINFISISIPRAMTRYNPKLLSFTFCKEITDELSSNIVTNFLIEKELSLLCRYKCICRIV
jgi:hypothetical protein